MKPLPTLGAQMGAAVLAFSLAGSLQAAITDNLAVHLAFDNNLSDTSGNKLDGTASGNPAFVDGLLGKAVSLTTLKDGTQIDYVSLGAPDLLKFGSDVDFSVSFWCNYTNQIDDPAFISNKDWGSSNNQGWIISSQGGGNFRVNVTDDQGSSHKQNDVPATVIRDGAWHLVTVTFARKTEATIYVDGALIETSPLTMVTGSIDTDYPINIGQDGTGSYTDGGSAEMVDVKIDDLGIWRRVLSSGEVTAIFNAGKSGKDLSQITAITEPYVDSTTPGLKATGVSPTAPLVAVIQDGLNQVATNSIQLILNGVTVEPTITKSGSTTTVQYVPATLLPNGANTAVLIFGDNAKPQVFATNTLSFTTAYTRLTADVKVTPDTSKRGFIWNVFANQANIANSTARAESGLAGLLVDADGNALPNLADPTFQSIAIGPAAAANPANASIKFEIESTINLSITAGTELGNFTPDDQMPGVPATDGSTDGLAAEILTFIELPAGVTTMGIASDDGYRVTMGAPQDTISAIVASEYQGGAAGSQTFMVYAPEAGVYAFRAIYENGSGGGYLEWYTFKADGTKVLLNDSANGGLKAYRTATSEIHPSIKLVQPPMAPRQLHDVYSTVVVMVADGTTAVDANSISLKVDGSPVTIAKQRLGAAVKVTYTPTTAQIPGDLHSAELTFADAAGAYTGTKNWQFYNLKNIIVPTAVVTENFDSYAEGSVPTGWNAWNFTDAIPEAAGDDLDNLKSDSYKGWIVVSPSRVTGTESDMVNVAPNQMINGQAVTSLIDGNILFAESDVRSGNQAQFIITKPYDMSKVTNVVITFSSIYLQNQDSMGAVEYSVDGGASWLPGLYYLDSINSGGDIAYNADGTVDAVKTFTNPNTDTAAWTNNGVAKGGKYGDGIAAPITAALGAFIVPRSDDEKTLANRVEILRLAQAGLKSDVRLRFAQLGTGSWYFAIDNLAFYEGPAPTASVVVTPAKFNPPTRSNQSVTLSWTGTGTLQEAATVIGPWSDSASQTNPQTVTAAGAKFYRIKQ